MQRGRLTVPFWENTGGRSIIQQERSKTGLTEMMISGQCLMETALLHDNEGQAIGHAPFLVGSCSSSRVDQSGGPSRFRERAVFRNDGGGAEHSSSVSIVTTTRVFGKRARGSSGLKTWPSNVA